MARLVALPMVSTVQYVFMYFQQYRTVFVTFLGGQPKFFKLKFQTLYCELLTKERENLIQCRLRSELNGAMRKKTESEFTASFNWR